MKDNATQSQAAKRLIRKCMRTSNDTPWWLKLGMGKCVNPKTGRNFSYDEGLKLLK